MISPMKNKFSTLYIGLFLLLFSSCNNEPHKLSISKTDSHYIEVKADSLHPIDSEVEGIIKPYRVKMEKDMNKLVAFSEQELFKSKPSGTLNNAVADMVFESLSENTNFEIDFCLLNYGGLRRPLPKGEILKSDVFQLMPFQNEAVIVKVNADGMKNFFKYLYFSGGQPVSALKVTYIDSINFNAKIQNQEWDSSKSYWVLTSDYTANGGDKMNFFAQRDSVIMTGILLRDAMFDYLEKLKNNNVSLKADTVQRIIFE